MELDLTNLDRSTISAAMTKYFNQCLLMIDYIPIVGPMYNATYALNLLFSFWPGKQVEGEDEDEVSRGKSRLVRVKGMTAIATALIDIFTLCFTLGVLAFVCDCLVRINTFAFIRQLLILFIMANVIALTVGAKIVTGQLVEHLTQQLEEMNSVSTSMVKSVTITASAIERIVETTNTKTVSVVTQLNQWWIEVWAWVMAVVTFPAMCWLTARSELNLRVAKYRGRALNYVIQCRRLATTVRRMIPMLPYLPQIKAD